VDGPDDLRALRNEWRGDVVLKPADRAGSLGVQILCAGDDADDADDAWGQLVAQDADDPMLPSTESRRGILLEERLIGAEYSVEALVREGRMVWANATAKCVWPGRYPVEAGHDVPAPAGAPSHALTRATGDLVAALGFGHGVLHAEWIVREGVPHLVECAGRPPGDGIVDLIDSAYGCDVLGLYLKIMMGRPITPPVAKSGAAVRFLRAEPGRVESVTGLEAAREIPGVSRVAVYPQPGEQITEVRSSWLRPGQVVATGETVELAAAAAESAVAAITIRTVRDAAD
jgi:biotin carboxylase